MNDGPPANDVWTATMRSQSAPSELPRSRSKPGPKPTNPVAVCWNCKCPFRRRNPNDPAADKFCTRECQSIWRRSEAGRNRARQKAFRQHGTGSYGKIGESFRQFCRMVRAEIAAADAARTPPPPVRKLPFQPDEAMRRAIAEGREEIRAVHGQGHKL
jgi:hypothetical protein